MRAIRWLLPTILIVLPLVAAVHAEPPGPHWELNLEAAKRQAAQTNRLVLIHFWATWCGPCRNLEANVFTQPGVSQAIEARFVPVKVNSDDFPATAKLFAIERLPTDVIITPSGRLLYKLACPQDPTQYVAQLNQAATAAAGLLAGNAAPPGQNPNQFAQAPANPVAPIVNPVRPATGAAQAAPPPPGLAIYSNENYSAYLNRNAPPAAPGCACCSYRRWTAKSAGRSELHFGRRTDDTAVRSAAGLPGCSAKSDSAAGPRWVLPGDARRAGSHGSARCALLDARRCPLWRRPSRDAVSVHRTGRTEAIHGQSRSI